MLRSRWSCATRTRSTRTWRSSSSSISCGSPSRWTRRRRDGHVGRGRRFLLRRAAPAGRQADALKVRSMVGLLPLCAVDRLRGRVGRATSRSSPKLHRAVPARRHPELLAAIHDPIEARGFKRATARCHPEREQARRVLAQHARRERVPRSATASARSRATTSSIRSSFDVGGQDYSVPYLPAESDTGMFGGNSNWRGPVWMPVNCLIVRALLQSLPTTATTSKSNARPAPGSMMNLFEVARGDLRAAGEHLPARRGRAAAGVRRHGEVPGRSALARLPPVLRVLPRRQRRGPRREPPDGLDRARRAAACTCSRRLTPKAARLEVERGAADARTPPSKSAATSVRRRVKHDGCPRAILRSTRSTPASG